MLFFKYLIINYVLTLVCMLFVYILGVVLTKKKLFFCLKYVYFYIFNIVFHNIMHYLYWYLLLYYFLWLRMSKLV